MHNCKRVIVYESTFSYLYRAYYYNWSCIIAIVEIKCRALVYDITSRVATKLDLFLDNICLELHKWIELESVGSPLFIHNKYYETSLLVFYAVDYLCI